MQNLTDVLCQLPHFGSSENAGIHVAVWKSMLSADMIVKLQGTQLV